MNKVEIVCSACRADTLLNRTPVYEGFKKTGETLRCSACGHEYASEDDVPSKGTETVRVFDESDASRPVDVFGGDTVRNCRHCKHYVVNPFTQKCALSFKDVEASDFCDEFEEAPADDSGDGEDA